MYTQRLPTYLGQNILVVIDTVPGFLEAFRSSITSFSGTVDKSFTLLCCCPTHYWEHGGADNREIHQQIENMTKKEQDEFEIAETCLDQARAILQDAGVLDSHIRSKIASEDSPIAATMNELKQHHYTGVIVSKYHQDIVARLLRTGITDIFRKVPVVEVHTLDLAMSVASQDR